MKDDEIRKVVREGYAKIARENSSCCSPVSSCCGNTSMAESISKNIGYNDEELNSVPDGSNLGLGCGNPVAHASLKEGEVVLDLGAGAGFDCFLAANKVGNTGKVIGVDMTPDMVEKARGNAKKEKYENVEFRLGEIEHLPVADNSVDAIISNCVINLSPEKGQVFQEAFRVLKSGGRLMVSDITLLKELPDFIRESVASYVGCISGALLKHEYLDEINKAGFADIKIIDESVFPVDYIVNDPTAQAVINKIGVSVDEINDMARSVVSIKVHAVKP